MFEHVIGLVREQPWAILPSKLVAIQDLLRLRAAGLTLTDEDIRARIGAAVPRPQATRGTVAVIPVRGVIAQRMNMMTDMSGGTSTEQLAAQFRVFAGDSSVETIVLDIDSPGGGVYGVPELAAEILEARKNKTIVAIVNSLAASAAYWLAASATEIVITPSGEAGSIGVYGTHEDYSALEEKMGVKTTLVSAGKYKVEGNPFAPLDEDAHKALQARVDAYYDLFVRAVAKGRGATPAAVRNGYGEGRVLTAQAAVDAKLADRIASYDETMARLTSGRRSTAPARAQAAPMPMPEKPEKMEPDEDGKCDDGYEMGDDGMCHMAKRSGADPKSREGLDAQQADAQIVAAVELRDDRRERESRLRLAGQ
jgi:signal peptide peptidase SppA